MVRRKNTLTAHETPKSWSQHLYTTVDMRNAAFVHVDHDAHVDARNVILISKLIDEVAAAMRVGAAEKEVRVSNPKPNFLRENVATDYHHLRIRSHMADRPPGDEYLRPTDVTSRRPDQPVQARLVD